MNLFLESSEEENGAGLAEDALAALADSGSGARDGTTDGGTRRSAELFLSRRSC